MITRLNKMFTGKEFSGKTYLILNEAISRYDFYRVNTRRFGTIYTSALSGECA